MPISTTLPDGSDTRIPAGGQRRRGGRVIGAGLAKAALAGKVDGRLVDTGYRIERDCALAIVTDKDAEASI
jgi:threonyl-tRNA synthetase